MLYCTLYICRSPRLFLGSSLSLVGIVLSSPPGEAGCNILGGQHGRQPGGSGRGGGGGRGGQGRRERSAPRRCTIARHETGRQSSTLPSATRPSPPLELVQEFRLDEVVEEGLALVSLRFFDQAGSACAESRKYIHIGNDRVGRDVWRLRRGWLNPRPP